MSEAAAAGSSSPPSDEVTLEGSAASAPKDAKKELQETYLAFTKGEKEIDGRGFSKMCKDSKLYDKSYTATDADLIFARVKPKGARKMNFTCFLKCLEAVAEKKKVPNEEVWGAIVGAQGPVYTGTKPVATRFHDDKSLYSGVHAHGGPSTVDTGRSGFTQLSEICDRSSATVRGVNVAVALDQVAKPKRTSSSKKPAGSSPPSESKKTDTSG